MQSKNSLKNKIKNLNVKHFILMGVLNCITNLLPPTNNGLIGNIDLYQTLRIPNPIHSRNIVEWLGDNFIIDKFRSLYPQKLEYSYIPFNKTASNKSRIDHCLCSPSFSNFISNVEYLNLLSKRFDHKPILITCGKKKNTILRCKTTQSLNLIVIDYMR